MSSDGRSGPDGVGRPAVGWFVLLDGGIVVLTTLSASASVYEAVRRRLPAPPRRTLQAMLAATAVIHVAEAAYAYRHAGRRGSPVPARWAVQTLVVGFPSLARLRHLGSGSAA